jgi:hypothetical protein
MKKFNIFDVRTIIGLLLLIYGVILVLVSFTTSQEELARANGTNANLWVGLALVLVAVLMIGWAVLRPIEIDEEQVERDKREVDEAAGRSHGETSGGAV